MFKRKRSKKHNLLKKSIINLYLIQNSWYIDSQIVEVKRVTIKCILWTNVKSLTKRSGQIMYSLKDIPGCETLKSLILEPRIVFE